MNALGSLLAIHAMPLRNRYRKAVRRGEEMAKVRTATRKNLKTKAGTEITPEIADTLASEAERGATAPLGFTPQHR